MQDLTEILQRIPSQNYEEDIDDFQELNFENRLAILQLLGRKPTLRRVKELFGSWLKVLIEAGILEDGTRKTSRGIQSLAKDGHVCLSLGEKTIDDFLYTRGIPHEKEPHYPEGNFRADFLVNGIFIEYFGLKGNPDYDRKMRHKQQLCRKHGIELISLYPKDLINLKKLEKKLSRILR